MTGNGAIPSPSHQSAHARGRDSLSLCLPAPCNTPRASATALDSLSDTGRLSPGGACTDTAADRPVPFPQRDIVIYTRRRHVLPHCTNPSVQYAGYSSLLHTYTTRGVLRLLGTAPLGVCLFLLSACSPARIRPRIRVAHAHKSAQGQPSKARKGRERRRGGAWSEGERRHARRTAVSQGPASTFDGFPVGRACECLLVPPSAKYIRVQWRAVRRALCAVPWPPTVPVRPAGADLAGLLPAASCLVRWFVCVPALGKVVYHIGRVGVAPTLPCTSGQQCTGTMGRGGPLLCEGPLVCCSARVSCVSQHLFIRNCV